ncbi:MAG: type II toxin-antitoxin system HicA family toxin [Candidatus Berkelbacteria bacterium]|nr:type II toxin-antitoxin system HicA family toxin [Candidatus Berkelbacteria bacterium]
MTDLPSLKPKVVARALEKSGFVFVRQKGSHRLYRRGDYSTTVPIHKKDLKMPTLRAIISQAGFTAKEFIGLLKD